MLSGSSLSFARGLSTVFANTYKPINTRVQADLREIYDMGLTSDGAGEDYYYNLAAPHPTRVDKGDIVPEQGFGGRGFRVVNFAYELKVAWHVDTEADDQTDSLVDQARSAGANFGTLDERLFFQVLQSTSDSELLPSIPLAGDGAALFSTTDGTGAARFGVTGGNILSVADLTRPGNVRSAIWSSISRMNRFQDGQGQPRYPSGYVRQKGICILYSDQNNELLEEAVRQRITTSVVQNAAGSENVGAAGVTNTLLDGMPIKMIASNRISGNELYVAMMNPPTRKAIFTQIREPLRDNIADFSNSDRTREAKIRALYWRKRQGVGVAGEPLNIIKIVES